jgi:hypothetical protein
MWWSTSLSTLPSMLKWELRETAFVEIDQGILMVLQVLVYL